MIEIPGIWQPTAPDDILGPGSMVICIGGTTSNIPPGVDVSDDKLPGASAAACKVMDVFGVPRDDVLLMMLIREFRSLHLMLCGTHMP